MVYIQQPLIEEKSLRMVVSSDVVRVIARAYFMLVFFLVAIVGDRCCQLRTRLKLLHGRHVELFAMTGWLRELGSFKALWTFRRFPSGWLGALMMLCTLLTITSDLTVANFITDVKLPSRCPFVKGIVIQPQSADYPNINSFAYTWAFAAQSTSVANGGLGGIYSKVINTTNFAAQKSDVLGQWVCTDTKSGVMLKGPEYPTDLDIRSELEKQGLLYEGSQGFYSTSDDVDENSPLGGIRQMVAVSASEDQGGIFSIKAAIDTHDDLDHDVRSMTAYKCTIHGGASDILPNIDTTWTISQWGGGIQGLMYTSLSVNASLDSGYLQSTLEIVLNTMTMLSGGYSDITSVPDTTSSTNNDTYGCLRAFTWVPIGILALAGLSAIILIILTTYAVVIQLYIFHAQKKYDKVQSSSTSSTLSSKAIILHGPPNDLLSWMQHVAYEASSTAPTNPNMSSHTYFPRPHQLVDWVFKTYKSGPDSETRLGLVRKSALEEHYSDNPTVGDSGNGYDHGSVPMATMRGDHQSMSPLDTTRDRHAAAKYFGSPSRNQTHIDIPMAATRHHKRGYSVVANDVGV